jgi:cytochrome o ubiquinol oxidase operon protein cyoD
MVVQLHYFFHLGQESKPRWNLLMFLFMALVLVVVVFGSLWIMYSLEHYDMR